MADVSLILAIIAIAGTALNGLYQLLGNIKSSRCGKNCGCETREPNENGSSGAINHDLIDVIKELSKESDDDAPSKSKPTSPSKSGKPSKPTYSPAQSPSTNSSKSEQEEEIDSPYVSYTDEYIFCV